LLTGGLTIVKEMKNRLYTILLCKTLFESGKYLTEENEIILVNNMVSEKVISCFGKNIDISSLKQSIIDYLTSQGFKTQASKESPHGVLIQAQKGGFLRDIIAAERSLNILISGDPNNIIIRIGIGKWIQNLAVTAVETLLLSELFMFVDIPEMLWNFEVENKIAKDIAQTFCK
jgi:hypothetical protein